MEQESNREKRAAARTPIHCPVTLIGDYVLGEGTVINLSVLGCGIKSTTPLHQGTYVELRMLPPNSELPVPVELAKVKWVAGTQIGIQFIHVKTKEISRLSCMLAAI